MGSGERRGALADVQNELLTALREGRMTALRVGLTTQPLTLLALPGIHEFRLHGKGPLGLPVSPLEDQGCCY